MVDNNRYTRQELIDEIYRFIIENNKVPRLTNMNKKNGYPSFMSYFNYFNSWDEVLNVSNARNFCKTQLKKNSLVMCCEICKSKDTISHWYYRDNKRICNKCYTSDRNYLYGILDSNSTTGIGVITEHIVYKVLKDCIKCNTQEDFLSDYDLISKKYKNINVKASKLCKVDNCNSYYWGFNIRKNSKIPDNYVCLGFNENRSKILYVWIIPKESGLINLGGICITNSERGLQRSLQYEVDPTPYNEVYQNLDITTLPEFRNIKQNDTSIAGDIF